MSVSEDEIISRIRGMVGTELSPLSDLETQLVHREKFCDARSLKAARLSMIDNGELHTKQVRARGGRVVPMCRLPETEPEQPSHDAEDDQDDRLLDVSIRSTMSGIEAAHARRAMPTTNRQDRGLPQYVRSVLQLFGSTLGTTIEWSVLRDKLVPDDMSESDLQQALHHLHVLGRVLTSPQQGEAPHPSMTYRLEKRRNITVVQQQYDREREAIALDQFSDRATRSRDDIMSALKSDQATKYIISGTLQSLRAQGWIRKVDSNGDPAPGIRKGIHYRLL